MAASLIIGNDARVEKKIYKVSNKMRRKEKSVTEREVEDGKRNEKRYNKVRIN